MQRKIVLFADNDPDFLQTRTEFLKNEGFQVLPASSPVEAERLLKETRIHLVILDIRLVNDDDEKDTSGIHLAQQEDFHNVPKIILTNFPSVSTFRSVLKSQSIDYVIKEEGPQALIDAINNAFAHYVHINWSLVLDWQANNSFALVSRVEPGLEGERLLNRAEELEDLFRRLFYEKDRVRIDRVLWQHDGRVALTVFAFKGAAVDSFVVVCGQNARVVEEAARFDKFAPKAHSETTTTPAHKAETTHFAANAYSLGQTDLETIHSLRDVYRAGDKKIFTQAIETLFGKTLTAWQGLPTPIDRALEDLYRERLALSAEHVSPQAIQARWQALVRYVPELKNIVPNPEPIIALLKSREQLTQTVKSPGTLTGENILIDSNARAWLTDFADAGDAPQFWNFVVLESAVRFDWVEEKELQCLRDIEDRLLDDSHFGRPDPQSIDPSAQKVVRSIQPLRRYAARAVSKEYWQYHLGIFFNAARRVADFDPTVTPTPNGRARLAHALLAMALIAAKVGHLERQVAASSEYGLRVDKDGVQRDGKRVSVRGQSRALLNYLADRCEHTCSSRELVENVLRDKFDQKDKHQVGRLQTAIRRLREKIEYDPDNPRYVITESDGYRLVLCPDE